MMMQYLLLLMVGVTVISGGGDLCFKGKILSSETGRFLSINEEGEVSADTDKGKWYYYI